MTPVVVPQMDLDKGPIGPAADQDAAILFVCIIGLLTVLLISFILLALRHGEKIDSPKD